MPQKSKDCIHSLLNTINARIS